MCIDENFCEMQGQACNKYYRCTYHDFHFNDEKEIITKLLLLVYKKCKKIFLLIINYYF